MDEGDYVEKGQPLVLLDPSDTAIALQQAEANLASTVRQGAWPRQHRRQLPCTSSCQKVARKQRKVTPCAGEKLSVRCHCGGRSGALP
ncbi:HlyD family secretion protein [Klebsiella variicola subsp. variicola]|nr:HlyD family secretion protein [Klebsiella variicola subsp. variicola]